MKIQRGGLYYEDGFISPQERQEILAWLKTIYPIWEQRFSANNPPPKGQAQRMLLRPVYWLGNWQFACLDYYHPPKGILNRCVRAEPFPEVLARVVARIEAQVRKMFKGPPDLPAKWKLNTCLINYYGSRIENGKRIDVARVGEHKDFEPGPVGSISFGDRAFFQFVSSRRIGTRDAVVYQQWLEDSALQIFGGHKYKNLLFHRVQRVDKKRKDKFDLNADDFETRRINFTFRYVPEEHIVDFKDLPRALADDVQGYVDVLAKHSDFFAEAKAAVAKKHE